MEDWNTLAADCVVISCCCQCLILQVVVFIFLRLPYKLVRKTKEFAKKFRHRKRDEVIKESETSQYRDEFLRIHGGCVRIQMEGLSISECHGCGCCMEEVESVLEGLSQKGEFAFGSFWGRDKSGGFPTCVAKQEFDYSVVQYHLIEIVGPFSYS